VLGRISDKQGSGKDLEGKRKFLVYSDLEVVGMGKL
jgi:hypothetical protein